MAATLKLGDDWDLSLNAEGDIAIAEGLEAIAQDAASAVKTFEGEVYYDTTIGVPYLSQILGHATPSLALIKQWLVDAALRVPGVVSAQCYLTALSNRGLSGQIQVISSTGELSAANFSIINPQTGAMQ